VSEGEHFSAFQARSHRAISIMLHTSLFSVDYPFAENPPGTEWLKTL
jgi:hypothetical protein